MRPQQQTCSGHDWTIDSDGDVQVKTHDGEFVYLTEKDLLKMLKTMDISSGKRIGR
jgi:hypothetical protein